MRLRNTIIVVVLLAIIGGYALYVGHHPVSKNPIPLGTLAAGDIKKIELRSPSGDIVVERGKDNQTWLLAKPVIARAEQATVDEMASALANLQVTDTVEQNPDDLADFGLARPAVTVTVTTSDNRVLPAILVGKQTPIGNSAYIKMADAPAVLLVASTFPANVEKSVDDLRARALFTLKPAAVQRFVIAPGAGGTELEAQRNGDNWTFLKPVHAPADSAAVEQFLDAVTPAQVSGFVDDKPADLNKYGLGSPSLRITLYGDKHQQPESLLFGFKVPEADKNAIYVRRGEGSDQPVVSVADYLFTIANKTFDDLRDKTLLTFDQSNVERIVVGGGPPPSTLARAPGGKWSITAGGKSGNAEVLVAESLLDQLHDLHGTKIVEDPMTDPKRYGMERPSIAFTLYSKDGKEIGTLNVSELVVTNASPEGGGRPAPQHFGYATTSANQAVYEVPPDKVSDLGRTITRLEGDLSATPTPAPSTSALPATPPPPP